MRIKLVVLFLCLFTSLSMMGQGTVSRDKCRKCGLFISKCPYKGHHPAQKPEATCNICGKAVSKCAYKGHHPAPKPEATCNICGKAVSKCAYKGHHPASHNTTVCVVTFRCNVPSATLYIDNTNYGKVSNARHSLYAGRHEIILKAEGYDYISKSFNVKSDTTLVFSMKKKPVTAQPADTPSYLKDYRTFTVADVQFTMVYVQGGEFTMGATREQWNEADPDEKPEHSVKLKDFMIGQTEVTQKLWLTVMGNNPSHIKGDNLPVDNVSWDDCNKFLKKLNSLTGQKFRLPAESEWEYAARGGKRSHNYKYSGGQDIKQIAWHTGNSGSKAHPVGQLSPNELGIYDMSGNVWEWCYDCYQNYNNTKLTDSPKNPHVMRGGCWSNPPSGCRTSNRTFGNPKDHSDYLGFRLAL